MRPRAGTNLYRAAGMGCWIWTGFGVKLAVGIQMTSSNPLNSTSSSDNNRCKWQHNSWCTEYLLCEAGIMLSILHFSSFLCQRGTLPLSWLLQKWHDAMYVKHPAQRTWQRRCSRNLSSFAPRSYTQPVADARLKCGVQLTGMTSLTPTKGTHKQFNWGKVATEYKHSVIILN